MPSTVSKVSPGCARPPRSGGAMDAPDHGGHHRPTVRLRHGRVEHFGAAPEHDNAVANGKDVVQFVADQQHGCAASRQGADSVEKAGALIRRQDCGRLVEDQDGGVARQHPCDFHPLLLADRQCAGAGARIEPQVEAGRDVRQPPPQR